MDPVVVTLPHCHGKAEATRRIKAGIEALRARYTAQLKIAEENWEGDRLRFRAAVKEHVLRVANVLTLLGLGLLAFAVSAVTYVITDLIYPGAAPRTQLRHRRPPGQDGNARALFPE